MTRGSGLTRRETLAALASMMMPAGVRAAEPYPNKTVRVIVPYAAGGAVDAVARILANGLQQRMGQAFIVENKPGASANLGADAVAKSAPDGYTLLVTANAIATNMVLFPKLGFNTMTDLQPITRVGFAPLIIVTPPSLPANTLGELIALAKAKPEELTYASTGNGSSNHLATELLKSAAGITVRHVTYRGGAPAITDLLGERISMMMINPIEALPYLEAKQLKALAVAHETRFALLPDVPTTSEAGLAGVEASVWWGCLAPAGTPPEIVQKLNRETHATLMDATTGARFRAMGIVSNPDTPDQFKAYLQSEIDRWREVIKTANIRPD